MQDIEALHHHYPLSERVAIISVRRRPAARVLLLKRQAAPPPPRQFFAMRPSHKETRHIITPSFY
jgi:hypothetical protein